ncbi:IclR family transcriptional regulator [Paenirhodobacter sp.]|uniref:IclR family transcriptional regulator n=1 Tax=Paenirhodobacter sp. TaxID=1965326 RepID=UPI003B40C433
MTEENESGDRQFVTALARGLDILSCYKKGDRFLSNQELARRTGLARPTVSRLTYTLTKTGHLIRDENSGEYRLSPKALRLGFSVLAAVDISERFALDMQALSKGPNPYVTVALAEQSGTRAVYLAALRSHQAISLSVSVGARLPLFYSAIGRAILAAMSEAKRARILAQGIREFPGQRERMEQGVRDALRDYATYGYCTSFGSWKPESNAIAAPLISADGTTLYGVNVGGPSFLVTPEELHTEYGPRLLDALADIGPQ